MDSSVAVIVIFVCIAAGFLLREYLYRKEEDDLEEWMMGVERDE